MSVLKTMILIHLKYQYNDPWMGPEPSNPSLPEIQDFYEHTDKTVKFLPQPKTTKEKVALSRLSATLRWCEERMKHLK